MEIHSAGAAAVAKEPITIMVTIRRMIPPLFRCSYIKDPFRSILFLVNSGLGDFSLFHCW